MHSDQGRPADCRRCRASRRGRRTTSGQRRGERRAVVGVEGDRDQQVVARHRHRDVVPAVGAVERRDVELLVDAGPALLVGVDEVGVPAAVGVVHLDDRAGRGARPVEAPEDADRVEAVAEGARVRGHQHAAAGEVDAARGQEGVDVRADRGVGRAEVVAGLEPAERGRGRAARRGRPARRATGARTACGTAGAGCAGSSRRTAPGSRQARAVPRQAEVLGGGGTGARAVLVEAPPVVGAGEGDPLRVRLGQPPLRGDRLGL